MITESRPRLLSASEAAARYFADKNASGIRRLARAHVLPSVRLGRRVYFDPLAIESWLRARSRERA